MTAKRTLVLILVCVLAGCSSNNAMPQGQPAASKTIAPQPVTQTADMEKGFITPPPSSRPWVYWFPLSGNLTKEGITADLEAMARAGIGGALYMEVDQGAPKGKADFAGPLWRELFKHACNEARRLGLQINMNNDAGWCGSGGPWITPELSMQKITWSERFVEGGKKFEDVLAQPPTVKNYYRDIAVLAFPTPAGDDMLMNAANPRFTTSGKMPKAGRFSLEPPRDKQPQFVQIEFAKPFPARLLTANLGGGKNPMQCSLQISDDGRTFKTVKSFSAKAPAISLNFEPVTARFYRIAFTRCTDPHQAKIDVSDLDLSSRYRIENIFGKACFVPQKLAPAPADYPATPEGVAVSRPQIVDLSAKMDAWGNLTWNAPAGNWTVVRLGCTTTGKDNHPAPESGRGLECDKLSKEATAVMFNGLMGKLIEENKSLAGADKTLVSTHIDSWEVGSQNWTPRLREEFRRRRGYDLWNFLPVFTGRIVDSTEVTERFLWDLRQTLSDMLIENYAGEFRRLANQHGMRLSIEAYDGVAADELSYGGQADEPMAEFWSWNKFSAAYSCTEMASSAHVYGKKILGAEAFTATDAEKWQGHPANIKDLGDWAFCEGINRFVFHRYAAQPWANPDRAPGMSMGPWGLHYERTQTWWEQSTAWHEYLSRCQFLLQQGLFVADVLYLQPEGAPQRFAPPAEVWAGPNIRGGYNFDGCSPEVVLTRLSVKDGRLVLPDGMSYRVLVLPNVQTMTPRLLAKIRKLVDAGATVIGPALPPVKSPGLADMGEGDAKVKTLAGELWPKLVTDKTAPQLLASRGIKPDFSATPLLRYIHRTINGAEVYFVANPNPHSVTASASFRISGSQPELWHPDSGRITPAGMFEEKDGLTRLPLQLEPSGSVFVVFRKVSSPASAVVSISRNGKELFNLAAPAAASATEAKNPSIAGTFTLAAWVKPAADTALPAETAKGTTALNIHRNDVLYAAPGHEAWTLADSGAGLSVGRNGVTVCEHGADYFAAVLVYPAVLSDWTHLAVVYRDGVPSLYVNGRLVRTGLKGPLAVHAPIGAVHARSVAPFKGQVSALQQIARALSEAEIAQLARTRPLTIDVVDDMPAVDLAHGEICLKGNYVLKTSNGKTRTIEAALPAPLELAGPWAVRFAPKLGAPEMVTLDKLISWSDHPDAGVKYFSGTARYYRSFDLPAEYRPAPGRTLYLDLGRVEVMAEVKLNGKSLGIAWKPPYRLDISSAARAGNNELEVKVVNLWINRLIGDEQLPEDSDRNPNGTLKSWPKWLEEGKPSPAGRYTFTSWRLWKKDSPLVESGLLGPVRIIQTMKME